jgi:GR25 family glycosyltransferase involved in LPS biosynthesis
MKLFERFDEVFCVNLDRRPDRLENFNKQVEKYDLGNYTRVSAVDGKLLAPEEKSGRLQDGELGLLLTVEKIISYSIEKEYETILVVEDDCYFTEEINNIDVYFEHLPSDWNMLYMGGNHNIHMGMPPPQIINEKVARLHNTFTTHFVGIKNNVFNLILENIKERSKPLDMLYSDLQKKINAYTFYPAIAKQISDYSDIQSRVVDYNWLIK